MPFRVVLLAHNLKTCQHANSSWQKSVTIAEWSRLIRVNRNFSWHSNNIRYVCSDNCLTDEANVYNQEEYDEHTKKLPGEFHDADAQCKLIHGETSRLCEVRLYAPILDWISSGSPNSIFEPANEKSQQNGMCAQRRLKSARADDQTGQMPRLIWVFAGRLCHLVGFVVRWLIYR